MIPVQSSAGDDTELLVIDAPAKINWMLRVLGKRPDGFHEIETIFQTISLRDRIEIRPAREFELTCSDPSIPCDATNTISRAVDQLSRVSGSALPALAIHLEKRIPAGGGLGGGSSNAASVLRLLRDRYAPEVSELEMAEIAARLGSDVPFFLLGGMAWATGRGERLETLAPLDSIPLLLVLPHERVSTSEAYRLLERGAVEPGHGRDREEIRTLAEEGPLLQPSAFTNDFEPYIFQQVPRLARLRERLEEAGARWARLSGSGSTLVGAFTDPDSRERARDRLRDLPEPVVMAETADR